MDSLHLFTIPKWIPSKLPAEVWAIIFCWKWRLEMKDIHRFLIKKMSNIHTYSIQGLNNYYDYRRGFYNVAKKFGYTNESERSWVDVMYHQTESSFPLHELNMYTGNYWLKVDNSINYKYPKSILIMVYNKCGIELLFPYSMNFSPDGYGIIKLYEHVKNDLDIDCSKNTTYHQMKKLCQSI